MMPADAPVEQPATPPAEQHVIKRHQLFYVVNAKDETIAQVRTYPRHGVRWMTDVWVDPEHRQKGLATRLIREALAAHAGEAIYLTVHGYTNQPLSDEQLACWYGSFGFVQAGAPGVMVRYPEAQ
jgi:GNAT superfamily N-acetyltransferase